MKAELLQGFYLGNVRIEPLTREVTGPHSSTQVSPKAAEVLLQLAAAPGKMQSREFLLEKVWGEGRGSPEALSKVVRELRRALDDPAQSPRFIQTLPGRGYRLILEPRPAAAAGDGTAAGGSGAAELGFFESLQQRGVFEAAIAYLVLGWLIIQVADVVFEQLLFPQWVGTFVTVLVIAGFPIVLGLSWLLEFRDGRARFDKGPDASQPRQRFSRTYLSVVSALAISALLVFLYDQTIGLPEPDDSQSVAGPDVEELPPVEANSIAVLKFLNIDGSDIAEVFASGFAEGMINRLTRLPSLLVASRGDAWSLGESSSSEDVRRRLRVAYFVEGSVQLIDDRLRVTVTLVDSATGFQLTTRTFDEPIEDWNKVQRDLINVTVANLRIALPPESGALLEALDEAADLDAYILYRKGREVFERPRTTESLDEAIRLYEQSLAFDPDYAAAHAGLCTAYVVLYALSTEPADIESAEAACAAALRSSPRLPVVHDALGDLYRRTGRLAAAEEAYERALDINAQDVQAMVGLAEVYRRTERLSRAEVLLVDAIGKQPGNWRTINRYGGYLFSMGRYDEAASAYRQVVLLAPDNFQARTNLGSAYLLAGEFERGRRALEEALEIQPIERTYSNLGVAYYYLGDFNRSVAMHRQAVELTPGQSVNWLNLADALHFAGDDAASRDAFMKAGELAESALTVDPADAEALVTLAWTRHRLGKSDEALDMIARALEIDPEDPYSYYFGALIQNQTGDTDAALAALGQALEKGYPASFLVAEPFLGELRADPRFHEIVAASFQ